MSGKQRQEATIAVPAKKDDEKKKEKEEDAKPVEKALPNSVLDPGDDSLACFCLGLPFQIRFTYQSFILFWC